MSTGLSLFSGAGGFDLGFHLAGGTTIKAIEIEARPCQTLTQNFPLVDVECSDIRGIETASLPSVDIVFGGPPCQAFSMIGKRREQDERSLLVWEYLRVVQDVRPPCFVMENVPGLTHGNVRSRVFEPLLTSFRDLGYKLNVWELNAAHYGTPQWRKRIFVVGSKTGIPEPEPEPVIPTVKNALSWLPAMELSSDGVILAPRFGEPTTPFGRYLYYSRPLYRLTNCQLTSHSPRIVERFNTVKPGTVDTVSRFPRLSLDPIPTSKHTWAKHGVAPTLRAGTTSARGTFTAAGLIHPTLDRKLTPRECACLSGFPGWFTFEGGIADALRQIGNAVPPLLAQKVLAQVMRYGL